MGFFCLIGFGLLQIVSLYSPITADDDLSPTTATPVRFDFAQWCKVGGHTLILEKTTLADVVQELKCGVIRFNGKDAAGGEYYLDYLDKGRLVRFCSNAEMGGDTHDLEGIEIRLPTASEKGSSLPSLSLPITFRFGSVGMSFLDLSKVLGKAVIKHGAAWYEYSGKRPIKVSNGQTLDYDVLSALRLEIVAGKVTAIRLSRVSSS